MHQEEEGAVLEENAAKDINNSQVLAYNGNYKIVIAVCAILSVIFMKTGFMSLFFLVPVGFAVIFTGSLWQPFFAAAITNVIISVFIHTLVGNNNSLWTDILYFSVVMLVFTWVIGGKNLRTVYRYVLASTAGAIAFIVLVLNNKNDTSFNRFLAEMAELFSSIYASSSVNEVNILTADRLLEFIKSISLRGGALVSMLLVFFINHQLTMAVIRFIKRQRINNANSIIMFFAPANTVWVLSGALTAVILTSMLRIGFIEIIAWNVLSVCVIIFITQGAGIIMFQLAKRTMLFRFAAGVIIFFLIISPLNTIAIGALLLLGIAEIWLPLRRVRSLES